MLLANQAKLGNKWAAISQFLPGRTKLHVRDRFRTLHKPTSGGAASATKAIIDLVRATGGDPTNPSDTAAACAVQAAARATAAIQGAATATQIAANMAAAAVRLANGAKSSKETASMLPPSFQSLQVAMPMALNVGSMHSHLPSAALPASNIGSAVTFNPPSSRFDLAVVEEMDFGTKWEVV